MRMLQRKPSRVKRYFKHEKIHHAAFAIYFMVGIINQPQYYTFMRTYFIGYACANEITPMYVQAVKMGEMFRMCRRNPL